MLFQSSRVSFVSIPVLTNTPSPFKANFTRTIVRFNRHVGHKDKKKAQNSKNKKWEEIYKEENECGYKR